MHAISSIYGHSSLSPPCLPLLDSEAVRTFHWCPKLSISNKSPLSSRPRRFQSPVCPVFSSNDGAIDVVDFVDSVENDWSSLDSEYSNADAELSNKIDRIISAGNIKETSKVLVSLGSEAFVDKLVSSSPSEHLLVVHDSLLILAAIKEKYDKVKCWQGDLMNIPEKWAPFDVVFLCFLPAMPPELHQVLTSLARHCSPGAMVVICNPQGRQAVEDQKQRFPNVAISSLPEESKLLQIAADPFFEVVESTDEPGFYLSVLRLKTA